MVLPAWMCVTFLQEVKTMGWDGDDLAGKMEEVFERQQAAADARAHKGTSSPEERARSAAFETFRLSRARILDQLGRATNPAHRTMLERALQSLTAGAGLASGATGPEKLST
jgi:hypothetical protein